MTPPASPEPKRRELEPPIASTRSMSKVSSSVVSERRKPSRRGLLIWSPRIVIDFGSWRSPSTMPRTSSPPLMTAAPSPPIFQSMSVMSTVPMSSSIWRLKTLASSGVLLSEVLVPVTELVLVAS